MHVRLGIDRLEEFSDLFKDKRIGLLTNHTGINSRFESTIDLLHHNFQLVKLFAPEHGVRGNLQAGVGMQGYTDERTGLPVISLYGEARKPTAEQLTDIDMLVFDIQDVGSRFYTYLYTMAYIMQACAAAGKSVVVFDRPNPIGATAVEGNLLEDSCRSFIGLYPIPQRYGLTIGECAQLFNAEYSINCDLTVVEMQNYHRNMFYDETGLPWVLPSPNIPMADTCFTYNATCIFEGTNISEGRGTTRPFDFVGAPWLDGFRLADVLNQLALPGVFFRPHYFTPLPYLSSGSKYAGELCGGVEVHVLDRLTFCPVQTGVMMLYTIRKMYSNRFAFTPPYRKGGLHMIDYNTGGAYIREGLGTEEVMARYTNDSAIFTKLKHKYELY